jgi:hypothetical protein
MQSHRCLTALLAACLTASVNAADGTPQFDADGALVRPDDYREWVFVTSGLGMTYGPTRPERGQPPRFSNVFVNPDAYRAFTQSGKWPDGTFFVLEVRESEQNVSIDSGGRTQGRLVALEASVKDQRRFPESGWAYFAFGARRVTAPLPRSDVCYSCHAEHGAVEWTFSQFYPELFEIARRLGTVRSDYEPGALTGR